MGQIRQVQRQTDLLSQTGLWWCLINDKRNRERWGGGLFDGGIEGRKFSTRVNNVQMTKTVSSVRYDP